MSKTQGAMTVAEAGRLGGLKGGRDGGMTRKFALTDAERREIARAAAQARWGDIHSCGHPHRIHAKSDGKCLATGCKCRGE